MKGLICANGNLKKASVTVIFDNKQKQFSPSSYKEHDTIEVTWEVTHEKCKYLINQKTVTNEKVKELFLSVHLNIANPHFLIKQGEIIKLMKMKPKELLSKIEEAAGTALYETWRQDTLSTLEKKDLKLKEIDYILEKEINPNLEAIKKSKENSMVLKDLEEDLDKYGKLTKILEMLWLKDEINIK